MYTAQSRFAIRRDGIRRRLLKYTRQAFKLLPQLDHHRILDIGCGSGVPTLELARLSTGEIVAVDSDAAALQILDSRIKKLKLSGRVKTLNCAIQEMQFPAPSFDLIWAEGSIFVLGFEKSLRAWKPLLKAGGFLVMHDEKGDVEAKLKTIASCGLMLISYFCLDRQTWWDEYFALLEKLIKQTLERSEGAVKTDHEVLQAQRDIAIFKKNPQASESVCFIMQRAGPP
jgi:ubiquinone/menaquinone biosynthesis C-methylase UbiE